MQYDVILWYAILKYCDWCAIIALDMECAERLTLSRWLVMQMRMVTFIKMCSREVEGSTARRCMSYWYVFRLPQLVGWIYSIGSHLSVYFKIFLSLFINHAPKSSHSLQWDFVWCNRLDFQVNISCVVLFLAIRFIWIRCRRVFIL